MVKSKTSNINYVEKSTIEPDDDNYETKCFVTPVKLENKINVLVCFGKTIRSPNSNVYKYKSLYIVKNKKVFKKIGCYEFHEDNENRIFKTNKVNETTIENFNEYGIVLMFNSIITLDLISSCEYKEDENNIIDIKIHDDNNDNNSKFQDNDNEYDEMDTSVTPKSLEDDNVLFKNDTIFTFYIRSADAKPGKGVNESIPINDIHKFENLNKIKHWRRILSNFYTKLENNQVVSLFKDGEFSWASTEHYFQAQKFKKFPQYYKSFALESDSELSKSAKYAKEVGEKGKLNGKKYLPNEIFSTKNDTNQEENMEIAQRMKYNQDPLSKEVLIATRNAKLQHMSSQKKSTDGPIVFYDTMRIRKELLSA